MVNKALAYELTKIVPLDVLETFREHPDRPNDLIDVGRKLKSSHLPGWLVYAIDESDHKIAALDVKIPSYIEKETICEVAEDYAEAENPIINLNRPGERDWMQEDPMKPYRDAFEREYESAKSAIVEVLHDVLQDEFDDIDAEFVNAIATGIIEKVDMFSWELYRQEVAESVEDVDKQVAEWMVAELSPHALAQSYLIEIKEIDDYEDFLQQTQEVKSLFVDAIASAELSEYEGSHLSVFGAVPLDDERVNQLREEKIESMREPEDT